MILPTSNSGPFLGLVEGIMVSAITVVAGHSSSTGGVNIAFSTLHVAAISQFWTASSKLWLIPEEVEVDSILDNQDGPKKSAVIVS